MEEGAFLALAAGLEEKSEHPLAEAIMEYTGAKGIAPARMEEFVSVPGRGVKGKMERRVVFCRKSGDDGRAEYFPGKSAGTAGCSGG